MGYYSLSARRISILLLDAVKCRPILLNSISGCVLFAGSDALAQRIEYDRRHRCRLDESQSVFRFDCRRMLSTGALGVFFSGCMYPKAYAILDQAWSETSVRHVVTKSLVEIATVGSL